jgi:hypothetical protein
MVIKSKNLRPGQITSGLYILGQLSMMDKPYITAVANLAQASNIEARGLRIFSTMAKERPL